MFHVNHLTVLLLTCALAIGWVWERCRRKVERIKWQFDRIKLECVAYASRLEATELLFAEKLGKIERLQAALRGGKRVDIGDLAPERRLRAVDDIVRDVSEDFDRRQRDYERTGRYQRRTDHLTEEGPPDAA